MNPADIMAIEEAWAFYEACLCSGGPNRRKIASLFAKQEDTTLTLPHRNMTDRGYHKIERDKWADTLGNHPYNYFYSGTQMTLPLIDVEGETAQVIIPTSSFFCNVQSGSPMDVNACIEYMYGDFAREDEVWKVLHFNFSTYFSAPVWAWDTETDDSYACRECFHELGEVPFDIMSYGYDADMPWPGGLPAGVADPRYETND